MSLSSKNYDSSLKSDFFQLLLLLSLKAVESVFQKSSSLFESSKFLWIKDRLSGYLLISFSLWDRFVFVAMRTEQNLKNCLCTSFLAEVLGVEPGVILYLPISTSSDINGSLFLTQL